MIGIMPTTPGKKFTTETKCKPRAVDTPTRHEHEQGKCSIASCPINLEVVARSKASYSYACRPWVIDMVVNEGAHTLSYTLSILKITGIDKLAPKGIVPKRLQCADFTLSKGWDWYRDKEIKESFQIALNHRVNSLRPMSQRTT